MQLECLHDDHIYVKERERDQNKCMALPFHGMVHSCVPM